MEFTTEQKRAINQMHAEAIKPLMAEIERLTAALVNIDAVAIDHGHYESAARTMKEHALSALRLAPNHTGE